MTRRAGLERRATPESLDALRSAFAGWSRAPPIRDPVPVLLAQAARRVLGQRVAVPLPVRGPHEGGDDLEVPLTDVGCLTPEVGQAEVDIELEQIDT